jgi:hypothetical protein
MGIGAGACTIFTRLFCNDRKRVAKRTRAKPRHHCFEAVAESDVMLEGEAIILNVKRIMQVEQQDAS